MTDSVNEVLDDVEFAVNDLDLVYLMQQSHYLRQLIFCDFVAVDLRIMNDNVMDSSPKSLKLNFNIYLSFVVQLLLTDDSRVKVNFIYQ